MGIKLLGFLFSFLTSIFLSRKLGANNFGIYSFLSRYVEYFSVFALFGADMIVSRSAYKLNISLKRLFSSSFFKHRVYLGLSLLIILAFLSEYIAKYFLDSQQYKWVVISASVGGLIYFITKIVIAYIVSFNKIKTSIFTGQMLFQLVVLSILLLLAFMGYISLKLAVMAFVFARIFTLLISIFLALKIKTNHVNKFSINSTGYFKIWLVNILSLGIYGSDLFVVAWIFSNNEVAAYAVVTRLTVFFLFHIHVVNEHMKGFISNSTSSSDIYIEYRMRTKQLIKSSLFVLLFIGLSGKIFLGFWGPEYVNYYYLLLIVSFGQFCNASFGPAGAVLIMLGEERRHAQITSICIAILCLLVLYATKYSNLIYVGLIYATVSLLENGMKYYSVRKLFSNEIIIKN